jgi:hypothetical protein
MLPVLIMSIKERRQIKFPGKWSKFRDPPLFDGHGGLKFTA